MTFRVAIATYPGREPYLAETVESFRAQGVEPVIYSDERWGPPKWNQAIDECTDDLLFIAHDDDVYDPTFVQEMVAFMESHPTVAAGFCMDRYIDVAGRRTAGGTSLPIPPQDTYNFKDIINGVLKHGNFLRCETVCLRVALVGNHRFVENQGEHGVAVDTVLWYTLLNEHPIGILNKTLVGYRIHPEQDTQKNRGSVQDHWDAMKYAESLRPEDVEWDNHIALSKMVHINNSNKEMERVKAKAKDSRVRLVVVHEPPDNAGCGVAAAHRVRTANEGEGEITYYVFPKADSTHVQEGYGNGCPIIVCPPNLFPMVVKRFKPTLIEYHHTLFWTDEILTVETDARKELYLHDQWMWSEEPHKEGKYRDTRKYLGGVKVYGNSEWTCAKAKDKLGVDVELFDPFVPLPNPFKIFRRRVGFFGGFHPTKGVHTILGAARRMPDVLFVLFSQPPQELMEGRQLFGHPNVVCMGHYSRADMHLLVHLVDTVVVPSLFESHGLVKRELDSLGVKVIATEVGGMRGTIPPTVEALVGAINGPVYDYEPYWRGGIY
jgi:hypothetical protein